MQQIFIELFSYKDSWLNLPEEQREAYRQGVLEAIAGQVAQGLDVISWGFNDHATDRRAPYDFYCVYRTPSADYQRQFEQDIAAAGWHEYFAQVNVSGRISTPESLFDALVKLERPPSP